LGASGRLLNFTVRHQFVLLRITGIVFVCLGLTLVAVGISGATHGAWMASFSTEVAQSQNPSVDAPTWLAHWRLWGWGVACAGGGVATAGAAVALNKRWGLLLLGIVLFIAAMAPWIVQWIGLTRYRFERAGLAETLAFLAFALLAIWGYFLSPEGRTDA
jgi:hypothetical protein